MALVRVATLPVSALNLGLGVGKVGLTAEIANLQAELLAMEPAIAVQEAFNLVPPDPTTLALSITDFTANIGSVLTPGAFPTVAANVSAEAAANLALVEAQIALVKGVTASLSAGVGAGGIVGWSYGGRSRGFGTRLGVATSAGFGNIAPSTEVSALVIATESFESWGSFSVGFETGTPGAQNLGNQTEQERLDLIGELSGGDWNTGTARLKARIDLLLAELEGTALTLRAQLQLAAGADLPDVDLLVDLIGGLDVEGVLASFFDVNVDVTASLGALQAKIDAALSFVAELDAQLSAGGLTFWVYTGKLRDLGTAMKAELDRGLPGGNGPNVPAYGLALACASPSAWADFGLIFKVAA